MHVCNDIYKYMYTLMDFCRVSLRCGGGDGGLQIGLYVYRSLNLYVCVDIYMYVCNTICI